MRKARRSGIKIRGALHPQSARPPATSAWWLVSEEEGMPGRKVQHRRTVIQMRGPVARRERQCSAGSLPP